MHKKGYQQFETFLTLLQETFLLEVLCDDDDSLLDTGVCRVNVDLWLLGGLVGSADAGKVLDDTGAGLLVETLGIALLGLFDGNVDVDFDEGKRGVCVCGLLVEFAGGLAVGLVRGDEGGQGEAGGVGEELCDLCVSLQSASSLLRDAKGEEIPLRFGGCSRYGSSRQSQGPC